VFLESRTDAGGALLIARGAWCASAAPELARAVAAAPLPGPRVTLDAQSLAALDLTGAYFLGELERRVRAAGAGLEWRGARPEMLEFTTTLAAPQAEARRARAPVEPLGQLGRWTVERGSAVHDVLEFLGRIQFVLGSALLRPQRLRIQSIVRHVYETGIQAIPIVALIAFLISVIVAYIGASVLRELGVLLTAIIVAGRSGSAFTAEIGVMRLNEEIDALRAIGLNVVEVLVLPRLLGLIIALPLLTVIADAMGLAGGAVLSWLALGIPFTQFLARMQDAIATTTFWAGLLKAPVFAFVIAMIGTLRGLQVRESSRELGRLTTTAVVQSIFMVLFVDAVFAVVYWETDF